MADKVNRLILQTIIDKVALANVKTELNNVRSQMRAFAESAKQSALSAVQAGKAIVDSFGKRATDPIEQVVKANEKLKKSFDEAKEAAKKAREAELDAAEPDFSSVGTSRLRTFGRELKALPAVQIPGLGISTDAIGKISQLLGALPPVALKTSGAILGVSTALIVLTQKANEAKQAALQDLDARQRALELLQAGNKEEVQSRIKALETQREKNRLALEDAKNFYNKFANEIEKSFGRTGLLIAEFNSEIGTGAGELKAAKEDIAGAQKAFDETTTELDLLKQGVDGLGDSAATAALQLAQANSQIAQNQSRISAQIEAANLAATGTEKQVRDRLDALAREKEVLQTNLPLLEKQVQQQEAGSDAQKALQSQVDNTRLRLSELDTTMLTLAGDALQAAKANDAAAEAAKEEQRIREESIKAVQKYNDDILKLQEQLNQNRATIEKRYGDQLVEIAERAAEAAENALQKLIEKRNDLALDLSRAGEDAQRKAQRDELEAQIEFQQDEAKAARDHARSLADIRRRAQEQEEDLALNRDFAGLFQLRRDTNRQVEDANRAYDEQRQERIIAFQQEAEDRRRAMAQEAEDQQIKYQRALADAQAQYLRELKAADAAQRKATAQASAAYTRDLQLAQAKYTSELNLRNQAIRTELQTIQQGQAAKLQLENQFWQQAVNIIKNAVNAVGGKATTTSSGGGGKRATGGLVRAGQPVNVNEPGISSGRESFTANGRTIPLPGAGLFTPMVAGRVNANSGGPNISITNYITGGADANAIGAAVDQRIERTLVRIFKPARGTA